MKSVSLKSNDRVHQQTKQWFASVTQNSSISGEQKGTADDQELSGEGGDYRAD